MNDSEWILVRIRKRIAYMITWLLRDASMGPHLEASKEKDPVKAAQLRQQGDDLHRTAEDIHKRL